MEVQMSSGSALVWKRQADEHAQSARMLTRVSIVLLMVMAATGAYAYGNHSRFKQLCQAVERQAVTAKADTSQKVSMDLIRSYCR
jgi:hypothetical protein